MDNVGEADRDRWMPDDDVMDENEGRLDMSES